MHGVSGTPHAARAASMAIIAPHQFPEAMRQTRLMVWCDTVQGARSCTTMISNACFAAPMLGSALLRTQRRGLPPKWRSIQEVTQMQ
jgi:hypothetical protein